MGAKEIIMPLWGLEVLKGARHLFPGVNLRRLQKLFTLWGGSIRWCLANAHSPMNEKRLEAGIKKAGVKRIKDAVSGNTVLDEVRCCTLQQDLQASRPTSYG